MRLSEKRWQMTKEFFNRSHTNYPLKDPPRSLDKFGRSESQIHAYPVPYCHRLIGAFGRHRGKPLDPFMLKPFKYPIIKHRVEQYIDQSLQIACKALSLDTPPIIPLMGIIGVFRWVHLATTDISITVDYVQATPYNLRLCFDVVLYLLVSIYMADT